MNMESFHDTKHVVHNYEGMNTALQEKVAEQRAMISDIENQLYEIRQSIIGIMYHNDIQDDLIDKLGKTISHEYGNTYE